MIIKYVHALYPDVEKTYDTEKALKNNPFIHRSQKEFDEMELKHMAHNRFVVRFEVVKELHSNGGN